MATATTTWFCDTCGESINEASHGYVEWIRFPDISNPEGGRIGRDLRLVHHRPHSTNPDGCQFIQRDEYAKDKGTVADASLVDFQGPNGLMRLLCLIADGILPTEEVLTMIQRIHIPGYEHAMQHIDEALQEGVVEPNMPPGFYWQSQIDSVLKMAAKKHKED